MTSSELDTPCRKKMAWLFNLTGVQVTFCQLSRSLLAFSGDILAFRLIEHEENEYCQLNILKDYELIFQVAFYRHIKYVLYNIDCLTLCFTVVLFNVYFSVACSSRLG